LENQSDPALQRPFLGNQSSVTTRPLFFYLLLVKNIAGGGQVMGKGQGGAQQKNDYQPIKNGTEAYPICIAHNFHPADF
jgi:hypothetical protein